MFCRVSDMLRQQQEVKLCSLLSFLLSLRICSRAGVTEAPVSKQSGKSFRVEPLALGPAVLVASVAAKLAGAPVWLQRLTDSGVSKDSSESDADWNL